MTTTTTHIYTIDAAGRTLGRVAAEASKILMGKTRADYTPNIATDLKVIINNASKISIREKKTKTMSYATYSGYPGGLRFETLSHLADRKGYDEVMIRTIERMLPRNRLRAIRMKNLTVNA
jgi:large subunit ribosomal protein L13